MSPAEHSLTLLYRIDTGNLITSVNPAWSDFARSNFGEAVLPERILGTNLLDSIEDETIGELYLQMIKRARQGKSLRFNYRCDAPGKRRTFEMNICQLANGEVEFSSSLQHEQARPSVAVLEPGQERSEELLRVCSWCQQVAMPDLRWLPVEEAVVELRLLEAEQLPRLTHGICPSCLAVMMVEIGRL